MKKIKIIECYGERNHITSSHRSSDINEAITKAIVKRYGKRAYLWEDSGISTSSLKYGQIVVPSSTGGSNCITGRVCITWY